MSQGGSQGVSPDCRPTSSQGGSPIVVFASRKGVRRATPLLRKHVAYRDVAQVVARVVRDHEAAGSNPVIPSMKHSDYVGVLHVETPFY